MTRHRQSRPTPGIFTTSTAERTRWQLCKPTDARVVLVVPPFGWPPTSQVLVGEFDDLAEFVISVRPKRTDGTAQVVLTVENLREDAPMELSGAAKRTATDGLTLHGRSRVEQECPSERQVRRIASHWLSRASDGLLVIEQRQQSAFFGEVG